MLAVGNHSLNCKKQQLPLSFIFDTIYDTNYNCKKIYVEMVKEVIESEDNNNEID